MDLIRELLLKVEERAPEDGDFQAADTFGITGRSELTVLEHVDLIARAGLVETIPMNVQQSPVTLHIVQRLTWSGHEFLDAVRHDTVWQKVKAKVEEQGGSASFEIVKMVALQVAKAKFGVDLK
jgi:hypothetical protein